MGADDEDPTFSLISFDFRGDLDKPTKPLSDNGEYMRLLELRFLLKHVRESTSLQLFTAYSRGDMLAVTTADAGQGEVQGQQAAAAAPAKSKSKTGAAPASTTSVQRSRTDHQRLAARIQQLDDALARHDAYVSQRLALCSDGAAATATATATAATPTAGGKRGAGSGKKGSSPRKPATAAPASGPSLPRILQLCHGYQLTPPEAALFQLLVVVQGSANALCINTLSTEDGNDYLRRMGMLMRVAGMSDVQVDLFCDPERQHIKEGLVTLDEENGLHFNLKVPRTAVQLLYGRPVRGDDVLKVREWERER